jgi:hypothetical protein
MPRSGRRVETHAASFASGGMVGKNNIVFGRGRPVIRALTVCPDAESIPTLFAHREVGRPLNVDDGARLARVGVKHGDLTGNASGK